MPSRTHRLGIPDLPDDLPYGLRDWCEGVQNQLLVLTDALNRQRGERVPTVDELIDVGIPNADKLKK